MLTAQTPFDKVLGASNLDLLKYEWIWEKSKSTGFLNSKKMPLKSHENVLVFYKNLPTYNPQMTIGKPYTSMTGSKTSNYGTFKSVLTINYGDRYPTSIQHFNHDIGLHPTQKPVALMEYMIKTYTNVGDTVLDSTMGSGTTGVACKNTNRKFIGIELNTNYFNLAKQRIDEHIVNAELF